MANGGSHGRPKPQPAKPAAGKGPKSSAKRARKA